MKRTVSQAPHTPAPVEEDLLESRPPSLPRRILKRVGVTLLIVLALVFAYLFLLLGEPDEEAKNAAGFTEETIQMPMSPFEAPGESQVEDLADTFGYPVLSIHQGVQMRKSRIFDTAFEGGYARCVTITYAFEDGTQLTVESIRPTAAVTLIDQAGYTLDATALYALGGLNAARMENDVNICVFAQSDTAVYAITCPQTHREEFDSLLRQTLLVEPHAQN